MYRRVIIGSVCFLALSGFMPYELQQEQEIATCAQLGYTPGDAAFAQCRMQVRAQMAQAEYEAASGAQFQAYVNNDAPEADYYYTQTPVYYQEEEDFHERHHQGQKHCPRLRPGHFLNEYGQDCKKTHRGWVMCK